PQRGEESERLRRQHAYTRRQLVSVLALERQLFRAEKHHDPPAGGCQRSRQLAPACGWPAFRQKAADAYADERQDCRSDSELESREDPQGRGLFIGADSVDRMVGTTRSQATCKRRNARVGVRCSFERQTDVEKIVRLTATPDPIVRAGQVRIEPT